MATMFVQPGEAGDGLRQHVRAGSAGNVVEDDGDVHRLGHGGEVSIVTLLRRFVVVRPDHQHAVRTGLAGELRQPQGFRGAVGAGAGHDLDPAAGPLHHGGDHLLVFLMVERGRLARGADGGQAIRAFLDVPVDQPAQSVVIDLAAAKWRDKCHCEARELFAFGCHFDGRG